MWKCKHCNGEFNFDKTTHKANHSRHCDQNPNKEKSYQGLRRAQLEIADKKLGVKKDYNVECDTCRSTFTVTERELQFPTKEKYYCGIKCANSVGGKSKAKKYYIPDESAGYVRIAWRYHERKCVVCGEDKIVAAHHYNEDHQDNRPENLIPLCPTHHQYMHSRHKPLIEEKVKDYLKNKWGIGEVGSR